MARTVRVENNFWDKEVLIGNVVAANGKSAIKTKITTKDGKDFIDVRKYVHLKGRKTGFGQHTNSGIAIPVESKEQIDNVIKLLVEARDVMFATPKNTKKKASK